jgi:transcriptional regulator with XRE-family HTH domain
MTLGDRLKELREHQGWTQQQAADHIGVSSQVISNYERDYREPSKDILVRIANVYKTTVDELLGRSLTIDPIILTDLYETYNDFPADIVDSMIKILTKSDDIQITENMRQDMRKALVSHLIRMANYEVEVPESDRELVSVFRDGLSMLQSRLERIRKAEEEEKQWEEKIRLADEETQRIVKETEELKVKVQQAKVEELKAKEKTEQMLEQIKEIELENKKLAEEKIRLENILKGFKIKDPI